MYLASARGREARYITCTMVAQALVAQTLAAWALAAWAHGAGALATLLAGLANHRSGSSLSGPTGWLGFPPSSGLPGQGWPLAPLHM